MIRPDCVETRREAAVLIAGGGLIAFRTDTFYGLGANPLNPPAIARIKGLKGRDGTKPILLLIAELADLNRLIVNRSEIFDAMAERFWPGPLTLVGTASEDVSEEVTAGGGTIGVRLPDDEGVRALVSICGGILSATSANLSGRPPARSAQEVAEYFPTGIDLIVDSGDVTTTEPSTVLDLSGDKPRIIREGAVSRDEIERELSL